MKCVPQQEIFLPVNQVEKYLREMSGCNKNKPEICALTGKNGTCK
jgi:hypothetical protein